MKIIKIILFLILISGVFFIGDVVHAETVTYSWIDSYQITSNFAEYKTRNMFDQIGVDVTVPAGDGTIKEIVFSSPNFKQNMSAYKVSFVGLIKPSTQALSENISCSSVMSTAGVIECLQYDSTYKPAYSFSVTAYSGGLRTNCDLTTDGLYFTATCPLVNSRALTNIRVTFVNTYIKNSGTYFVGLARDYNYFVDSNNAINSTLQNGFQTQVDTINQNSKNQIDAMNQNQLQANQNSQNEVNAMNKQTEATQEQTNTLKDSNVEVDDSFFSGFDNDTHGLTSIITAPLQLIGSITSSTCSPLGISIPFVEQTAYLPCMSNIYQTYFGEFFKLYQTITFGIVSYWVCVNIYAMVKGFKDPDSDRIEVLDL